jgi:single-strand DNA-binding protein
MSSINCHVMTGRLCADTELKYTNNGKPMATFTLAVDGFTKDDTSFFPCVIWGERAEKLQPMLTKGVSIGVQGATRLESWEKDGVKRTVAKCHVSDVTILYKPKTGSAATNNSDDDRVPF